MKDFSQEILKKIKDEKIEPKPRWEFLLKDYLVWGTGGLALVVGSLATSVIVYMLKNNDWEVYSSLNRSPLGFVIETMPYFWIACLIIFIALVNYNFKHTKKGYRIRVRYIILGTIAISIASGIFLYRFGLGKEIDENLASMMPYYGNHFNKINQRQRMWMSPERGMLVGVVININDNKIFQISDFDNRVWKIDAQKAEIIGPFGVKLNNGVRLVGRSRDLNLAIKELEERIFEARKVFPLPDKEWLGRHPLMFPPFQSMKSFDPSKKCQAESVCFPPKNITDSPINESEIIPFNMQRDLQEKVGKSCSRDSDCELPISFAIRSNCPYDAKCISSSCQVVCAQAYGNVTEEQKKSAMCQNDADCSCSFYAASDLKDCACLDQMCFAVVN